MAGISPAFSFYPQDYLSSPNVMVMTLEQRGAYIQLLSYQWIDKDCSLPNDPAQLAVLSGLGKRWNEVGTFVQQMFSVCSTGAKKKGAANGQRIANLRLRAEWQKQMERREKNRQAGVKSGAARRKSRQQLLNNRSTDAEPTGNLSSLSSVSSSPSKKTPPTPSSPEQEPELTPPSSDLWGGVCEMLRKAGTIISPQKLAAELRTNGVSAEEAERLIDFWQSRRGCWTVAQLVGRLRNLRHGENHTAGWPDPPTEMSAVMRANQASRSTAITRREIDKDLQERAATAEANARLERDHGDTLDSLSDKARDELAQVAFAGNDLALEIFRKNRGSRLQRLELLTQLAGTEVHS